MTDIQPIGLGAYTRPVYSSTGIDSDKDFIEFPPRESAETHYRFDPQQSSSKAVLFSETRFRELRFLRENVDVSHETHTSH